jgi:hypothetical protein
MAALETRDDRTEAGTPIPPGSTEQEIIDIKNHELPPLPKMTPQLADAPPQEQDQTTWGYSGISKEPREPEPAVPWEEPHPLKPPIPLRPPAGHSIAVEEEPIDPPAKFVPNPADAPENFAEMPNPEPVPNQMARAAVERRISGEEPVPVSGPYSAPGPYPQGPTNKGLHGQLAPEEDERELQVDDQTANPVPTTERLLQRPPEGADDPGSPQEDRRYD